MQVNLNSKGPEAESPATAVPQTGLSGWLDTRLTLRTDLKFDLRNDPSGQSVVFIEDPVRSKFFQIGVNEYELLRLLDGSRTFREIIEYQNSRSSGPVVNEEFANQVANWLVQSNLAFNELADPTARLDQMARALGRQRFLGMLNPIAFRIRLCNPNRWLAEIQPFCQWMFSRYFLLLWMALAIYAVSIAWTRWDELGAASLGILSGNRWLWLLTVWFLLKVIHETAHGVACRRYGGEVPEAGVLMLLFTPMAFVNVTSMWRFPNRLHRIIVSAAGMYIELFVSFAALILWSRLPAGPVSDICFNIVVMASLTTVLFNANPLMRFDGYYILSDLLNIPNLYPKGTRWFAGKLKTAFFGLPMPARICPDHERWKVAVYGTLAVVWKILICVSLVIGASVLFHGVGIALALVAVALWFGMPIYQQAVQIFGKKAVHTINKRRTLANGLLTCVLLASLAWFFTAPATKSAPAIVQFKDEQIMRAGADGFITTLYVKNGEQVERGQPLVELTNPQLNHEVYELEQKAEQARIQIRIHRQMGENSLVLEQQNLLEGILQQLREKREEAAGLVLHSPIDGFVFQRGLDNQLGSFVHRGDPVLNVADRSTKEVIVSIHQVDLESVKGNLGKNVRVIFPGNSLVIAPLVRINPRASEVPSHPSLCASAGGPLPVKPTSAHSDKDNIDGLRLVDPRFNVSLELGADLASRFDSGQRGKAFFSTRKESLGSYFYRGISNWLEAKIEMAVQAAPF